ncbi:MAG: adenylosuccinate synthase [Candidatus Caldarchaeum sp.]
MTRADVIVGLQWGDEGKGKISYVLARNAETVVRFQGGANAGHTVKIGETRYKFNMLPAGSLAGPRPVIAAGCLLDVEAFIREVEILKKAGHRYSPIISRAAHIVLPVHKLVDGRIEQLRGTAVVGTTLRGIGPAYADKMLRTGLRAGEATNPEKAKQRIEFLRRLHGVEFEADVDVLREKIAPYLGDVEVFLNDFLDSGGRVLLEGAQGTLLDIDHGTYPYVTSSNTVAANGFTSTGIPVSRKGVITGVMKAYTTRVGAGPFPTEVSGQLAEKIRESGGEYGTTTGRPRRVGWLDIPALKYACRINGVDQIAVTKLDVLSEIQTIKVCIRYQVDGRETENFAETLPFLEQVKPVYVDFDEWRARDDDWLRAVKNGWDELPPNVREYLDWLEKTLKVKIALVSVGEEASLIVGRKYASKQ